MRATAFVGAILVAGLTLWAAAAADPMPAARLEPPAHPSTPGSPGVGDPLLPLGGNGGYDVAHYQLKLDWQPAGNVLTASETVFATATQNLSAFDLDLRGFDVRLVTVNALPAAVFRPKGSQELTVTPARALGEHAPFVVRIDYAGTPTVVVDPDHAIEGWIPTDDGAFVANEPQGSPGWFAVNDTPGDKATYDVAITVPKGLTSVGNGALVSTRTVGGKTTFRWLERYPMAPHLVTITTGKFAVSTGRTNSGLPTYIAVDPSQAEASAPVLAKLPAIIDYFSGIFGWYPFETVGAIVDDAPDVEYSLETQTKPVFDHAPDEATLAHELAHQWFGDAVTLTQWPDIWLHEGFATWAEWLWAEHTGKQSTHDAFAKAYAAKPATDSFWKLPPTGLTDAADLFAGSVYDRGAMTLQALREKVGDRKFFTILRQWYAQHRYGNATTAEFIALSEKISGADLDAFFTAWLTTPRKPALS